MKEDTRVKPVFHQKIIDALVEAQRAVEGARGMIESLDDIEGQEEYDKSVAMSYYATYSMLSREMFELKQWIDQRVREYNDSIH